jgi:hypothetical protein
MKNSLCFLFLSIGMLCQAQLLDQVTLNDYGLMGNVLEIQETQSSWSANSKNFDKENIFKYQFDTNGYILRTEEYNTIKTMSYSKNYEQQTLVYGDNKTRTSYIIKTPARTFLTNTKDVVINANGTIQKVIAKPNGTLKDAKDFIYEFSYDANTIAIQTNSSNFSNKQRFTKEGLFLSEENDISKTYYFYHPKSKQLSQKISNTKYSKYGVYYINCYEYDKYGNWIVRYSFSAMPSIVSMVNPFAISVRSIKYKNNEKTGYETISGIQKLRGAYYSSSKMVNKLDSTNPYSFPVFIDYDFATNKSTTAVANTPSSPNVPEASSKCQGNCVDGYGKYTYDNGYYNGFWKNSQKNGYGTYYWNSGDYFYGNWVNDKMDGFGFTKLKNGSTYTGLYLNSKFNGNAFYMNKVTGKSEINYYENGNFIRSVPFNATGQTQGCTNGDCMNGYGKYAFKNGDLYIGDFQNGRMKVGTYVFVNGDIYTGNFNANNQFESYGFYLFKSSGNMYYGNWINGKRNGRGYGITNNKEEVGEWKDGVLITKMN